MISASRDGERIARITQHLGYAPVRGSTSKGSLAATRRLVAQSARGRAHARSRPTARAARAAARSPASSAVARLSGRPVVAIGIGVAALLAPAQLGSLRDSEAVLARALSSYSEPICVPREGGSDADYLARIQREMDRVTELAEARRSVSASTR